MPELADVAGFRRALEANMTRKPVRDVDVTDPQVLRDFTAGELRETLCGHSFGEPDRYGKWLIAPIRGTNSSLLFHFGMTGALVWSGPDEQRHKHDRVSIVVSDGELRYRDMRKLNGLYLARDSDDVDRRLADLGPDAYEISANELRERLLRRPRQLKSALLDQGMLAGLGNLLTDEVLWQARLNPRSRTVDLAGSDLARLHPALRTVLRRSSKAGCVPAWPSWLTGHRDGSPGTCPRCGAELTKGRVNSRATVWCPNCQQ